MDTAAYRTGLDRWLDEHATDLAPPFAGSGLLDEQMAQLAKVKRALFDAGWMRWGWPESVGGLGGPVDPAGACSARRSRPAGSWSRASTR